MALDIVTAYQGTNHVTAAQMADFQRGLLGGDCILPIGNKMKIEIQTANQLTVSDGIIVFDGIEFHIGYGQSENVAITSGTQGMLRNDIVCIQYNKDESTGIESAEFLAITGTPVASNPQDPAYTNLDIRTGVFMSQKPVCRVRLNGTSIEAIEMLVETFDAGIYQLNKNLIDTGWIKGTLTNLFKEYTTGSSGPEYRREGKKVYIRGVVSPKQNIRGDTNSNTIFILPEGFRPSRTEYCECQGSGKATWFLDISTDGEVRMSRYGAGTLQTAEANCWLPFSYNFPID